MDDLRFMRLAIDLAEKGLYSTGVNPRVGCVLVRDGQNLGQGFHRRPGDGHAEVNAMVDAATRHTDVSGATAYVSLEPCSHTGKTPPCCDALIAAKIAKVVVAMQDPNPLVSGAGIKRLEAAGIDIEIGVLEPEARALNPGFIKRMESGLPWVNAKLAMSLDGRTAMASGESQWITGPAARAEVQRLRARSCAILSGVDTIIADDASLTVRADELGLEQEQVQLAIEQQPLRVIVDSNLRMPLTAKILQQPGHTLLIAATENLTQQRALEKLGAEVAYLPNTAGQVDLSQLLYHLAERGCNEVLLESGPTLAGAMTEANLIDAYVIYMAPTLLGSLAKPLLSLGLDKMSQQRRLDIRNISAVGEDWRIDAYPKNGKPENSEPNNSES
jgi:diaminohydroxyphosphoribosylaminopyrimidine deaminase/5-amino-6-(5-phosphoribosylamino)uracil reductase